MTNPRRESPPRAPGVVGPRWFGVDAARGLAVLGMMAAHTWPRDSSQGELLVDGRPSVLFAVVAGVALGLVTGGTEPSLPHRKTARMRLSIRSAVLIALGVLLWMLPSGIAIILDYYGVMFVLLIPLLFAPRWLLTVAAGGLIVVAPLARDWAIGMTAAEPSGPLAADGIAAALLDYLLTGYYPALLWLPLLLGGLLCARAGLASTRVRVLMMGVGATASLAGYGAAAVLPSVDVTAHSGTTAELLGAGGLAVAIIGAALCALDGATPRRAARLVAAPLTALGRVAFTVYVAHVVVIAALAHLGPAGLFDAAVGIPLLVVLSLTGVAVGLLCQLTGRRGPLEWLLFTIADLPFRGTGQSARLSA